MRDIKAEGVKYDELLKYVSFLSQYARFNLRHIEVMELCPFRRYSNDCTQEEGTSTAEKVKKVRNVNFSKRWRVFVLFLLRSNCDVTVCFLNAFMLFSDE